VTVGQLTRIGQELASFAPTTGGGPAVGAAAALRAVSTGPGDTSGDPFDPPAGGPFGLAGLVGPPEAGAPAPTSAGGATSARMVLPNTVATPIVQREIMPRVTAVRVLSGTGGSIQSTR
jgi:hypothetical protein